MKTETIQTGPPIRTLEHVKEWCLVQRNNCVIMGKNGQLHILGWKNVRQMSLGGLVKRIEGGKLFEYHRD